MNGIYCGPPPLPEEIWTRWNLDPALLLGLAVLLVILPRSRAGYAALAVLVLAFVSPLCALSASLFSARVVHHVLIVTVAAPLIAIALPVRGTRAPALSLVVFTAVLWAWHVPAAYNLALSNMLVYWLMQATLAGAAIWFWGNVFTPAKSPIASLPLVVAGFAQMGLLGAVLTFAPVPLYAIHLVAPYAWGIQPLTDQQLGGLVMWAPGGIPFAVIAGVLVHRTLTQLASAAK